MHLTKYTEGWTRRHFLEQVSKGVFAAGVLSPLMDVIGRNGNCETAYPPELLSIEAYTRGELKAGDVLSAENVDIVKDLLDPGAYWQIKHDGRLVDLAPTETDLARLMPTAYLQATLANNGKHRIFPDGNVYTFDGKYKFDGKPGLAATSSRSLRVLQRFCGPTPSAGVNTTVRLTPCSTLKPMRTATSSMSTPPTMWNGRPSAA